MTIFNNFTIWNLNIFEDLNFIIYNSKYFKSRWKTNS